VSERSLVVHFAALDALVNAMQATHDEILATVHSTLQRVDAETSGWAPDTASRAAQTAYQRKLQGGVDQLCAALAKVRSSLETVRADAHDTEVRNVAVVS